MLDVTITAARPSVDELRIAFQVRSALMKHHYNISSVSSVPIETARLVKMAINRIPPFEEINIGKENKGIVGLQDTAILFSIMEHMKSANKHDRCVFISKDAVFHKVEVRKMLADAGLVLDFFKTTGELFKDLVSHAKEVVRNAWDAEMAQVKHSLNEQRDNLAEQIISLANPSELRNTPLVRLIKIDALTLVDFHSVMTDLEQVSLGPPQVFARDDGSAVNISVTATAEITGTVEKLELSNLFRFTTFSAPGESETITGEDTFRQSMSLSLEGVYRDGVIGNFKVLGVEALRIP
jgi:hypothetical protein